MVCEMKGSQDPEVRRGLFGLGLLILWDHKTYASSKRWQKRTKVKGGLNGTYKPTLCSHPLSFVTESCDSWTPVICSVCGTRRVTGPSSVHTYGVARTPFSFSLSRQLCHTQISARG